MTHIFDAVERELGIVIDHGKTDVQTVWQHITGNNTHPIGNISNPEPYDLTRQAAAPQPATTPGATVSLTDTITSVENDVATFKAIAAKIDTNPVFQAVLQLAEDAPVPVLATLAKSIPVIFGVLLEQHQASTAA